MAIELPRPPGIDCKDWTPKQIGKKLCEYYINEGMCALPKNFHCSEWVKHNPIVIEKKEQDKSHLPHGSSSVSPKRARDIAREEAAKRQLPMVAERAPDEGVEAHPVRDHLARLEATSEEWRLHRARWHELSEKERVRRKLVLEGIPSDLDSRKAYLDANLFARFFLYRNDDLIITLMSDEACVRWAQLYCLEKEEWLKDKWKVKNMYTDRIRELKMSEIKFPKMLKMPFTIK